MHRIKLTVAYDGTAYCGWQVQPNGTSVQSVLQAAVEALVGGKINLTGASRTDSGVHALGQVAIFDTDMDLDPRQFARAINVRLPEDIVVQESCEVPIDFHPRYAKIRKTYSYRVLNSSVPNPFLRRYSLFYPSRLDLQAMQEAAAILTGRHDFRSFSSKKPDVGSTVRTIESLTLERRGDLITLRVSGDGFLYHMVRILAGTLLKVGRGQKNITDIRQALRNPRFQAAGPTAPARGLLLEKIEYLE